MITNVHGMVWDYSRALSKRNKFCRIPTSKYCMEDAPDIFPGVNRVKKSSFTPRLVVFSHWEGAGVAATEDHPGVFTERECLG